MQTTISVLLEYRVRGAIENNVARGLRTWPWPAGVLECASLPLNRIKIRNKFSRSRYIKETGGVSVDRGGAVGCSIVKRKVVRY